MQKPVSFLGMMLSYGTIAKIFSWKVIPYLTPLIGALGIVFYYLLIAKIFDKRNAFLSALVLFSLPVRFYYSARSMFHNVPFVSFLIIGLYFSMLAIA